MYSRIFPVLDLATMELVLPDGRRISVVAIHNDPVRYAIYLGLVGR